MSAVPKPSNLDLEAELETSKKKIARLRRYTDLPSLIDILQTKRLTMLNPSSWDDGNDRRYLEYYKQEKKLTTLLALCLTEKAETYHHWKVFSGPHGVYIEFRRDELVKHFADANVRVLPVSYRRIPTVDTKNLSIDEVPFTKRLPYKDEEEVRAIYESQTETRATVPVPLDLACIERITLSPWLDQNRCQSLRQVLKSIPGCEDLNIYRSTLIENEKWAKWLDRNDEAPA